MSDFHGIKFSKEGIPVTSTTLVDYNFHSDYPTRNIKVRDSIEITSPTGDYPAPSTVTYTHDFGYIPQFMAFTRSYLSENFSKFASADLINLDIDLAHEQAGSKVYETLRAYTTETELVISAYLVDSVAGFQTGIEHTYTIEFILFMEEATPLL